MKARNYAIADKFKPKIYIPIIGVEIYGRLTFVILLLLNVLIVGVLGILLSFLFGSNGYYFAIFISLGCTFIGMEFMKQRNKDQGVNKLQEYYYTHIKGYNMIYDMQGHKHFINGKKKGVYFIHVR